MSTAEAAAAAVPAAEELLTRIRELQPLIEQHAAQGEQDRRVVEESIKALTDAGVFKIAQPRRYGGYQVSVRTMLDVSAAVAEADGGTGWVVALGNVCAWLTGLFSEQAQDEVWGADPDARVSGVLAPSCESVKVDGGFRVTGRWFYNSGSWHSSWAILGFPIVNAEGEMIDQGLALIPFTDLAIEETWFVAGMSSTGSNCLIATDVFVPEHRIMSGLQALEGQYPSAPTRRSTGPRSSRCSRWCWPDPSWGWAARRSSWSPRRRTPSRSPTPSTPPRPSRPRSNCSSRRPP
jgi:alkylation response protein AidB-like acyl-CoA dehydrogenase